MPKAHCGHCGAKKMTPDEQSKLRAHFAEVNKLGAARFTFDWLKANERAASAAVLLGIDSSDLRVKTLLAETCYRILAGSRSSRKG